MSSAREVGRLLSEYRKSGGVTAATAKYEFRMPLHYPRYSKSDYESMPEWQLDRLLSEYGLPVAGEVHQKRNFAMGAFLWPDHCTTTATGDGGKEEPKGAFGPAQVLKSIMGSLVNLFFNQKQLSS